MRRAVRLLVLAVTVLAILLLFVLPGRELLDQKHQLSSTQHRIDVLNRENAYLAGQAAALQSDAVVEQLARQKYGLVKPGEKAYVVLPAATPAGRAPTPPPVSTR